MSKVVIQTKTGIINRVRLKRCFSQSFAICCYASIFHNCYANLTQNSDFFIKCKLVICSKSILLFQIYFLFRNLTTFRIFIHTNCLHYTKLGISEQNNLRLPSLYLYGIDFHYGEPYCALSLPNNESMELPAQEHYKIPSPSGE